MIEILGAALEFSDISTLRSEVGSRGDINFHSNSNDNTNYEENEKEEDNDDPIMFGRVQALPNSVPSITDQIRNDAGQDSHNTCGVRNKQ